MTTQNRAGVSRADVLRGAGMTAVGVAAGSLLGTGAATASTGGQEHPNVKLIKDYYEAYASGDLNRLRRFFANDIRWTIPGHHPLSGTKVGVEEVLAFFAELGRAGFRAEPISLAADGDWVIDLHRGWSTRPEGLDITWALAFRIRARRIVEAVNFASDQHAADRYFWDAYRLAPLPDRLHRR
ncbi:nuclear transport factor 2 family protein [Saccharothrix syringae]|uniref:Nuclear transport factor 2 family protein n=1 Tax=Saccharothrix syringae TaxID=103733 RepID=A0A5Q0GSD7_SACSY|nr:nuclear transport factor 2 family protein [Saccharothrix syringae]QFZ17006.1 nuclear transport factor 2 family protein [Saccharothrix syringae]